MNTESLTPLQNEQDEFEAHVRIQDYLIREHGFDEATAIDHYRFISQAVGFSGNGLQDYQSIKDSKVELDERIGRVAKRFDQGFLERNSRLLFAGGVDTLWSIFSVAPETAAFLMDANPRAREGAGDDWRRVAETFRDYGSQAYETYGVDYMAQESFLGKAVGAAPTLAAVAASRGKLALPLMYIEATTAIEEAAGKKFSEMEGEEKARAIAARALYTPLAGAMEKLPVDKFFKAFMRGGPKQRVMNVIQSMLTEGGTEEGQQRLLRGLQQKIAAQDVDVFEADDLLGIAEEVITSDDLLVGMFLGAGTSISLESANAIYSGFLDPEKAATSLKFKQADKLFSDEEVAAVAYAKTGDPELAEVAVRAKHGDKEAVKEWVERTTDDASDLLNIAGREFEDAERDAANTLEEAKQDEARRIQMRDAAIDLLGIRQQADVYLDVDDTRTVSAIDALNQEADRQGLSDAERDAYIEQELMSAAANQGMSVKDFKKRIDDLQILGASTRERIGETIHYRQQLNENSDVTTVVEENAHTQFKRYVDQHGEQATLDRFLPFKQMIERESGEKTHGDSLAEIDEFMSGKQAIAWMMRNHDNPDATRTLSQEVIQWVKDFVQRIKTILGDADLLRTLDAEGKIDPVVKDFLRRATGDKIEAGAPQGDTAQIGETHVTPNEQTQSYPTANGGVIGPATFQIAAFHGTPHKVDKFSTDKIGTGEGAQAYGYGLYFAGDKAVAEDYRIQLKKSHQYSLHQSVDDAYIAASTSFIEDGQVPTVDMLQSIYPDADPQDLAAAIEVADGTSEGNLYTVELNVEEDQLLDWDAPLSEQPEFVWNALLENSPYAKTRMGESKVIDEGMPSGEIIYSQLARAFGGRGIGGKDVNKGRETSEFLSSIGIRGIRYLDGNSRSAGEGIRNYVIFDDADIRITHENGDPVDISSNADAAFSIALPAEVQERIERAAQVEPIEINLPSESKKKEARKVAADRAIEVFKDGIINEDTGRVVTLSGQSWRELKTFTPSLEKIAVLQRIDDVVKNAVWLTGAEVDDRPSKQRFKEQGGKYHYLAMPVQSTDGNGVAILTVQKDSNARNLYQINDVDIKKASSRTTPNKSGAQLEAKAATDGYTASAIESFLKSKSELIDTSASFSIALPAEVQERIERAAQVEPIDLKAGATKTDITPELFEQTLEMLRKGVVNRDTGKTITAQKKKLKHVDKNANEPVRVAIFKQIQEVLENSIWIAGEVPDARKRVQQQQGVRYHTLALPVSFEGQSYVALSTVVKDDKGRNLYNVRDIEIKETLKSTVVNKSTADEGKNLNDSTAQLIQEFVERKPELIDTSASFQIAPATAVDRRIMELREAEDDLAFVQQQRKEQADIPQEERLSDDEFAEQERRAKKRVEKAKERVIAARAQTPLVKRMEKQRVAAAERLQSEVRRRVDAIRQRENQSREDLTESIQELESLVKQLPLSIRGKYTGFGALSTLKTKEAQQRHLDQASEKLLGIFDQYLVKQNREKLEKKLKKFGTRSNAKRKKLLARYGNETTDALTLAYKVAQFEQVEIPEGMDPDVYSGILATFNGTLYAKDNKLPPDELAKRIKAALIETEIALNDGRFQIEQFVADRSRRREAVAEESVEAILRGSKQLNAQKLEALEYRRRKSAASPLRSAYDFLISGQNGLEQKMQVLDEAGGDLHQKQFYDEVWKAGQASDTLTRKELKTYTNQSTTLLSGGEKGIQLVKRLNAMKQRHAKTGIFFNNSKSSEGIALEQEMSVMQAVSLYNAMRDETLAATFEHMKIDEQTKRQVEQFIGKEGIAFADLLFEGYREKGLQVQQVFKETEGYAMDLVKNYGGKLYRIGRDNAATDAVDPAIGFDQNGRPTVKTGSMKERTDSTLPLLFKDADTEFTKHMVEMNHYIGHAQIAKELQTHFGRSEVKNAIIQKHGSGWYSELAGQEGHIADILRGGAQLAHFQGVLGTLRANVVRSTLGLNVPSFFKQLVSSPAYANQMPVDQWLKYEAEFWKNPLDNVKQVLDMDYIQNRMEGHHDRDINDAILKSRGLGISTIASIQDKVMFLTRFGDVGAIAVGGWPLWKYTYDQAIKAGKTEAEATAQADLKFGKATTNAQQDSAVHALGTHQRGNQFMRSFTMYMTSTIQYNRNAMMALAEANKARLSDKLTSEQKKVIYQQSAKTFLLFHTVLPAMFSAISQGFVGFWSDDEDVREKFWQNIAKAAVIGNLNSFFIAGGFVEGGVDMLFGWENDFGYGVDNPLFDAAEGILRDLRSDRDGKKLEAAIESASLFIGAPIKPILRQAQGVEAAAEGRTEAPIFRSLGWSEWSLGVEDGED